MNARRTEGRARRRLRRDQQGGHRFDTVDHESGFRDGQTVQRRTRVAIRSVFPRFARCMADERRIALRFGFDAIGETSLHLA